MKDIHNDALHQHFPCVFPVKVMGLNSEAFAPAILSIFHKHLKPEEISCSERLSSSKKYLSLTVTFTATSKAQLDAIYQDLKNHELVLMTL